MKNNFNDDIDYFYNNYKRATAKGKPNPRALKNLIIALEVNEIYLTTKQDGNTIR
jgi:hypothetical protein